MTAKNKIKDLFQDKHEIITSLKNKKENTKIVENKTQFKKNIISKNIENKLEITNSQKNFLKNDNNKDTTLNRDNTEQNTIKEKKDVTEKLLINSKNKNNYKILGELLEIIKNGKDNPYNPVLIKGNNETGKTFILEKIKKIINSKAYFVFARELSINLSSKEDITKFIKKMDLYDCIIIDDIHILSKDIFLQEELCFIIELLTKKNKHIIISINTEKKHKELSKELLNRIGMGLVISLPEPDLDIKMQYVQICLEEFNLQINKELSLFTARRCQHLRKIRSAVINIMTFYNNLGYLPNTNDLDIILKNTGNSINLDYEHIMSIVGKKYGFTSKEIKSDKREQRLIEARQISMYIARNLLGDTYQKIGKHFGGKDHTTVIYSIRKIEEIIVRNRDMHNTVTELSNMCKT